ncbi:MAG: LuxR C-terminal-related transcriptional regulator [Ilumatobacteraceae bacterium]
MGVEQLTRARDRLLAAERERATPVEVCEQTVRAVHDVAVFDWCAVMLTDADTTLPSGGVVEGFDPEHCAPFWDNELLDPDFNKFRDLLRSIDPVATLVDAVDGDLERSPRFTKLYRDLGVADELRVVFASGTSSLAVGVFVRAVDDGPFTAPEVDAVRQLVPVVTATLRRSLGRLAVEADEESPVVIIVDGNDDVAAVTQGGMRVLEDLRVQDLDTEPLPGLIRAAAMRARWSRSTATVTTRMFGQSGRWLRVHVAPLEGDSRSVAITVETAHPDDLVTILLQSYGFTPRETEIVVELSRGTPVKEIARELCISVHTVRDHIKAIYDKTGVSSRGELIAQLFTNHMLERFHDAVVHVGAN